MSKQQRVTSERHEMERRRGTSVDCKMQVIGPWFLSRSMVHWRLVIREKGERVSNVEWVEQTYTSKQQSTKNASVMRVNKKCISVEVIIQELMNASAVTTYVETNQN